LPLRELTGAGVACAEAMEERVGQMSDICAGYAFERAASVLRAIYIAREKDRGKVLDAMFNMKEFGGLVGTWSFSDTGDPGTATLLLNQIPDGIIRFVQTKTPPA
jgi:branched-chain amino acid transport system substrate-binding protein